MVLLSLLAAVTIGIVREKETLVFIILSMACTDLICYDAQYLPF